MLRFSAARFVRGLTLVLAATVLTAVSASATTLVASGDEWQLSSEAYQGTHAASTQALVRDIVSTFGGTNYLVLTGDASVNSGQLASFTSQLGTLGKSVTLSGSFSLALASGYDAVFHFGQLVNPTDIATYVNGGGNAYVSLGGGYYGNAAAEAAAWNPTLAQFGLVAGNSWFNCACFEHAAVSSGPAGVSDLTWGYGQTIDKLTPQSNSVSYVRGSFSGGPELGLIGKSPTGAAIPEPSAWLLMIGGLGMAGAVLRRRRATIAA